MSVWINKKNGQRYVVEGHATNKTNKQDGQQMFIYYLAEDFDKNLGDITKVQKYVRSQIEFMKKFKREF